MIRYLLAFLLTACMALATVHSTDGSSSSVSAAITAASNGDTIDIPAGNFTWTSQVSTGGKQLTIQGQGAGKVEGNSGTSWTPAVETKTFTTQAGLTWQAGDPVQIRRTGGERTSYGNPTVLTAEGTVSSYSGTSLAITIPIGGITGTTASAQRIWHFWRQPAVRTEIVNNMTQTANTTTTPLLVLPESTAGNVTVKGIRFLRGAAAVSSAAPQFSITYTASGQPVIVRDCFFYQTGPQFTAINANTNRGLIYSNSFVANLQPGSPNSGLGVRVDAESLTTSWSSLSSMGISGDPLGNLNIYVDNCDFVGYTNATDFDNNARAVVRYCRLDHAAIGTHGYDTSYYGVRHLEIYNNTFTYRGATDGQSLNNPRLMYWRGGTGVIYNNAISEINGGDYGTGKKEIDLTVQGLQRSSAALGCWGAGIPGIQYPAPRQVGFGFLTGAGVDGLGNIVDADVGEYVGDSEPLYYWGNTTTGTVEIGATNYDISGAECPSPDNVTSYIVIGRDVITDGTAKPGWTAYTYPHPLVSGDTASTRNPGRSNVKKGLF